MAFDVVCVGAATEDNFFFSKAFEVKGPHLLLPWKEKFTVSGFERHPGGGAFNASVAFARLGLKSAFFGRVGDDRAGRAVSEFLDSEDVSTKLLVVDPKAITSTSAILSRGGGKTPVRKPPPISQPFGFKGSQPEGFSSAGLGNTRVKEAGERTIVMYRGKNDDLLEVSPQWEKILTARWIFLTDLAGTNDDLTFEIVRRIKNRSVKLAYIPGQRDISLGKEKLKPVLERSEILVLNSYEARTVLGSPAGETPESPQPQGLFKKPLGFPDPGDKDPPAGEAGAGQIEDMLVEFKDLGARISVITQDIKGADAYDGKEFYHQNAVIPPRVVDVTGAGDAFSATFTAGIMLGKSVPESLGLAAKNASSVVTKVGGTAGLLPLSKLV